VTGVRDDELVGDLERDRSTGATSTQHDRTLATARGVDADFETIRSLTFEGVSSKLTRL
jgi:hypothetical protein